MFTISPLYLTINFFQVITLLLYEFGPIHYYYEGNVGLMYTYVILYLISFNVGYLSFSKIYLHKKEDLYKRYINRAILIGLVIAPLTFLFRVGTINLDVNIGELYSLARENKVESSFFEYIRIILSPFLFGLLPCVVWYWDELSKINKKLGVIVILINLLVSIFSGINQGIFLVILLSSFLILLKKRKQIFKAKTMTSMIVIAISVVAGLNFFVESQMTRSGSAAITGVSSNQGYYSDYNINDGKLAVLYSSMSAYLTQGYRALELSFNSDYEFTYGVGNSSFLSRQVDRVFDTNISDNALPAKIEEFGWDRYKYWSSFYLWWASDLHYVGVIILMFFIGSTLRVVENTLKIAPNYIAVVTYSYLIIMLFYLSANNQIFQSGESMVGFMIFLISCFFMQKKIIK